MKRKLYKESINKKEIQNQIENAIIDELKNFEGKITIDVDYPFKNGDLYDIQIQDQEYYVNELPDKTTYFDDFWDILMEYVNLNNDLELDVENEIVNHLNEYENVKNLFEDIVTGLLFDEYSNLYEKIAKNDFPQEYIENSNLYPIEDYISIVVEQIDFDSDFMVFTIDRQIDFNKINKNPYTFVQDVFDDKNWINNIDYNKIKEENEINDDKTLIEFILSHYVYDNYEINVIFDSLDKNTMESGSPHIFSNIIDLYSQEFSSIYPDFKYTKNIKDYFEESEYLKDQIKEIKQCANNLE